MNFKEKLTKVLDKLGFTKKFESHSLTAEEYKTLCEAYQKEYQSTLIDDIAAENSAQQDDQRQQEINQLYAIVQTANQSSDEEDDNSDDDEDNKDGDKDGNQQNATFAQLSQAVEKLAANVQSMAKKPAEDKPQSVVTATALPLNGFATTSAYLFGIEHSMFDMKKRWNQITANPRLAKTSDPDEQVDGAAFRQESMAFARSLCQRYKLHQERNELKDLKALSSGQFATDYSGVDNAGVGDQFVILRQDALIARILAKRDLTQFFPVRYGVQDRDLLFNAFMGETSQAYQTGEIYKGDMAIENEMGYVDDAMIKVKFGPMKEIERKYIAYLNREGSDPIKWSMIEFCLLNLLEQAQVEQNKRRMRGIYVKPETGIASSYLNAGTGVWYTLLRYIHDYSIKPFDDAAYRQYTSANMLDCVKEFISDVKSNITEDMDIDHHVLYLNKNHQDWWIANCRETYGKDIDFTGPDSMKNRVPDTDVQIKWLPYEGQSCWMFMDVPGNIQFVEYIPGEMLSVKMEEQMEMVRAWSTWKEGCGAAFTGRKFDTKEAMDKNAYEFQQIFTNLPAVSIVDKVDGKKGFWHITDANTTATDITDIENAKAGVAYCIEIGDESKLPNITKSGKFANLSAGWTPAKVGDYILVILDKDGNYRELERRVDGKRTINKEVQPNVPGGR